MRRLTSGIVLLPVLVGLLAAHGARGPESTDRHVDRRRRHAHGEGRHTSRLVQIDTPELGSGECYSRAARTALERLAPIGSTVTLEADPRLDQVDRYGRLLRYVRRGTLNVNIALVRAGAAAPYFYGGDRGRYAGRLLAEARQAKASRRGLWGACPGPSSIRTAPWTRAAGPRAAGTADAGSSAAAATRRTRAPASRRPPGPRLQGHPREGRHPFESSARTRTASTATTTAGAASSG